MKKIFALSLMALTAMFTMAQSYPQKVYLVGSATPVGWEKSALSMYTNGDGTYEYVGMLYNGNFGNEFKMLGAPDWLPSYGPVTSGTGIAVGENYNLETRTNNEMDDKKFTVSFDGRYHLTLNLTENKLYVDTADATLPDKNGNTQIVNLFLVGNGSGAGWAAENAIATTKVSEGVYTITTTIYGRTAEEQYNELKFLSAQTWDMPQVGPATDGEEFTGAGTYSAAIFTTGDNKWHNTTTVTQEYTITLDLNAGTMLVAEHKTTGLENDNDNANVNKVLRNGKLVILKNGAAYNVLGAQL